MAPQAVLPQLLSQIKNLRDSVPVFDPDDAESKQKIEQFHIKLHQLVMEVQTEVGFADYEQALKFIDTELLNAARLAQQ